MNQTSSELIERYKRESPTAKSRDRALLQREIADAAQRDPAAGGDKRKWVAQAIGVSEHAIEANFSLIALGDAAATLWDRADADMSIGTAAQLGRKAREVVFKTRCSWADAVKKVLEEYDALPLMTRLPDGKFLRKRLASQLRRDEPADRPPPPRSTSSSVSSPTSSVSEDAREFWAGIREMIGDYVRERLRGLDPMRVEEAWRALETDLKIVIDSHGGRLHRMRQQHGERSMLMNRGRIVAAHRALNLEPPPPGGAIDMKRVKQQFRKMALIYHPDKSKDESTRELYETCVEACSIIEQAYENQQRGD